MGMIIWPGEMEFWEQREAAQKQLREARERQAMQEAAWWGLVREQSPSGDDQDGLGAIADARNRVGMGRTPDFLRTLPATSGRPGSSQ